MADVNVLPPSLEGRDNREGKMKMQTDNKVHTGSQTRISPSPNLSLEGRGTLGR